VGRHGEGSEVPRTVTPTGTEESGVGTSTGTSGSAGAVGVGSAVGTGGTVGVVTVGVGGTVGVGTVGVGGTVAGAVVEDLDVDDPAVVDGRADDRVVVPVDAAPAEVGPAAPPPGAAPDAAGEPAGAGTPVTDVSAAPTVPGDDAGPDPLTCDPGPPVGCTLSGPEAPGRGLGVVSRDAVGLWAQGTRSPGRTGPPSRPMASTAT
jgi:hypothetical protein